MKRYDRASRFNVMREKIMEYKQKGYQSRFFIYMLNLSDSQFSHFLYNKKNLSNQRLEILENFFKESAKNEKMIKNIK